MRVLCDIDGVVANYNQRYLECLRLATGRFHRPEEITTWEYRDCLKLTPEDEKATDEILKHNLDLDEFPGAVDAVRDIARWHQVVFVTSPSYHIPEWTYRRQAWLEKRFPGLPVIHTKHKELIPGDVLIDDRPSNLRDWIYAHHNGWGILWAQPYNANEAYGFRYTREDSWDGVRRQLGWTKLGWKRE